MLGEKLHIKDANSKHVKIWNIYQQFNFFTLSKSEALALARTSFCVSFIAETKLIPKNNKQYLKCTILQQEPHCWLLNGWEHIINTTDSYGRSLSALARCYKASLVTAVFRINKKQAFFDKKYFW